MGANLGGGGYLQRRLKFSAAPRQPRLKPLALLLGHYNKCFQGRGAWTGNHVVVPGPSWMATLLKMDEESHHSLYFITSAGRRLLVFQPKITQKVLSAFSRNP